MQLIVNERREAGASLPHTHAQLYALDFVPAEVARERERCGAYATRTMGQSLLGDLVAEEVRRGERIVAIDEEAVLMAPFASRLPFQLMLAPRAPRMRFEDDGPTGAALLHDGLRGWRATSASSPPLNMWVRTAPRGAEHFCWRIDVLPRLTHLAGLELSTGVNLNIVAPEHAAAAAARAVAALPQDRLPRMPPEERFVPRFAAEPPQDELPYGRWERAPARGVPRRRRRASSRRRRISASRRRSSGTPTAPGTGARTCRRRRRRAGGYELFGYVRFCRAGEGGEPSDFLGHADFTAETAERNPDWQLDLCDEVIGSWRGEEGAVAAMTLVWGRPLVSGGRDRDRRAGRPGGRPVRADRGALHADRARRLPPGPAEQASWR